MTFEEYLIQEGLLDKAKGFMGKFTKALKQEGTESKEAVQTFFKLLKSNIKGDTPTEEEIKQALHQIKDASKVALVLVAIPLPMGLTTIAAIESLARKYKINMTLLPSAFKGVL